MFSLTWTAFALLEGDTPIAGPSPASWQEMDASFVATLVALDSATGQTLHARHVYRKEDIVFGSRFIDIFDTPAPGSLLEIDYRKFHQAEPDGI